MKCEITDCNNRAEWNIRHKKEWSLITSKYCTEHAKIMLEMPNTTGMNKLSETYEIA